MCSVCEVYQQVIKHTWNKWANLSPEVKKKKLIQKSALKSKLSWSTSCAQVYFKHASLLLIRQSSLVTHSLFFKLSHYSKAINLEGLSLCCPRNGKDFFLLDSKCASCFLQCFSLRLLTKWQPLWPSFNRPPHQTPCTSLTSKHLNTLSRWKNTPSLLSGASYFGIPGIFSVGNLHTMASTILNLSLASSEITLYCLNLPFCPCLVNFLQPDFQTAAVYDPLSVWQRCLPAFPSSLSIWGYDAVFGSAPLYNLSEANSYHTSPHVLFIPNMFPVNDSKYTGGCEEWLGKLPHTCHRHLRRLTC